MARKRFLLLGLGIVPLLVAVLFAFGQMHPHLATYGTMRTVTAPSMNPSVDVAWRGTAVDYADDRWNCWDVSCSSKVGEGDAQPNYECAEFVARSLAKAGWIWNLRADAPLQDYEHYQALDGNYYDLLLITPTPGLRTLAAMFLNLGYGTNIGHHLDQASRGDFVVFLDGNNVAQHTVIITTVTSSRASTLIDAHNNAHYHLPLSDEIAGFSNYYIVHVG